MNIAIIGTGYVGLVTGVGLASLGHQVICLDTDRGKIDLLRRGESPIHEPGLESLMADCGANLAYTWEPGIALHRADVIFICVGTPERADGGANLQQVYRAADSIAAYGPRGCVTTVKSTVPIGTGDRLEEYLQQRSGPDRALPVVSNPEFLAQGSAVRDTLHPARIVIGAGDEGALETVRAVFRDIDAPVLATDRRSAEAVKYASNDFLALKISYINEMANLCEAVGANIEDVSRGMGLDHRIGEAFLRAGIGYGGSCFPKDTKALHWMARYRDIELKTVRAAIEINENQRIKLLKKAKGYYSRLDGLEVAVLGLTFKPNTDDLREAPSLQNIRLLLEEGARVRVWDPTGCEKLPEDIRGGVTACATPCGALEGAGLCLVMTEWPQVRALTPRDFIRHMATPVILDGRNCFPLADMDGAPLVYDSIGRPRAGTLEVCPMTPVPRPVAPLRPGLTAV